MSRISLTIAALAASLATAQAADLPGSVPAPVPVVNWTGFYAGAHLGYGFGSELTGDAAFLAPLGVNVEPHGWLGGLQLGYNIQVNQLVFGLEADISLSGIKDSSAVSGTLTQPNVVLNGTLAANAEMQWLSTFRGRLGFTFDRALIYATGGLAIAEFEGRLSGSGTLTVNGNAVNFAAATSSTKTHVGWTLGAGVDFALDRNWSLRAEYLYVDLGKERYFAGTGADADLGFRGSIVRAGFNYRF